MQTYYDNEPKKVTYEPQADGTANVYIRQDIKQADQTRQGADSTTETVKVWTAEEKNFVTTATKDYVVQNADTLFYSQGDTPTVEQRLAAAEDTIAALMDLVATLQEGGTTTNG